ncbi:MAG: FlgD immunoglobulin-like domain containing protein [Candidatus Eisenbacteria bacterium]
MRSWTPVFSALLLFLFPFPAPSPAGLFPPGSPPDAPPVSFTAAPPFTALDAPNRITPAGAPKTGRSIDWEWTGGPEGAAIFCLVATPSGTLLAGTENGGLWRSADGGASWETTDDGLTWPCCNFTVQSLAAGPGAVYAGTWGGGVFRSDDDAVTWYTTGTIPDEGYPIIMALAACRFGDRVYAGGNFGVARTDDGGASWTLVNDGLPSAWVLALGLRGTVLYARLDAGIYRLDPNDLAWSLWNQGLYQDFGQQSFSATDGAFFLATHEGGVFRLDCADSAWVPLNDGLYDDNVDVVVEVDQTLYAGLMGGGAYRWDPSAAYWNMVNDGLWNWDIRSMTSRGLSPYAGTFGGGVFAFDPLSDTWSRASGGMTAPVVTSIVSDGGNLYAGMYGGGVWVSSDQGETWTLSVEGLGEVFVHRMAGGGSTVYAGTWNGVWKTTDQGASWESAGLQGNGVFALAPSPPVLYAGTYGNGVQVSGDGGENWNPVGSGLPPANVMGVERLGTSLYAALWGEGVYVLPDGESEWAPMNTGLPEFNMRCFVAGSGTLFLGLESKGVRRWNEANAEWDSSGLDGPAVFSLCDAGDRILAGSWGALYASTDTGSTWVNESGGLREFLAVYALESDDENFFAGLAGGGVWRAPRGTIAVPPAAESTPASSTRGFRAAPNPFVRDSRIAFGLDRSKEVRLEVFDASGRMVRSIVSGKLPAGFHERSWDGTNKEGAPAAAGVYFIRLVEDGRESTIKTIRLR